MTLHRLTVLGFIVGLVLVGVSWADEKNEDEAKEHKDAREGLAKAKITLREAVESALKKLPDGKAVEAWLEVEGDDVDFEVEVVMDGKHKEVEIDAMTGEVEQVKDEDDDDSADDEKTEDKLAKAPVGLLEALDAAAKKMPDGKPFKVEAEKEDGKLIFEVEFVAGDKIMEVEVDSSTGKVLEVEEEK